MKKKVISILIIIVIAIGMAFAMGTYAGTGQLFTNLSAMNPDGVGYGIGDPTNQGKYIWHMNTYDSVSGGLSEKQKDIYCLRAEYGSSWESFTNSSPILEYNLVFDFQTERQELLDKLVDNGNDADEIIQNLLDVNGTEYREILWLLDSLYIIGQTNKEEYLAKMGVAKDEYEGIVEYYNANTDQIYGEEILTDSDIMAIQRMAIWTITNGGDYDKTSNSNWLRITEDGSTYKLLSESRRLMAEDLYNYLVSSAKTGASLYTAENNYKIDTPIEVDVDGLTLNNGKYEINAEIIDSNYIIGPIKINKNNDFLYSILLTVKDEDDVEIDSSKYSFTDANGVSLGDVDLKDLVDRTDGFYIKLDTSLAETVNTEIKIIHYNTTKHLWLNGTETTSEIKLNAEQPVAEFSREEVTTTMTLMVEAEKTFDLSLFKHISAISKDQTIEAGEYITDTGNKDGTYLRAPVVTAIDSSTGKIAYKEHDKTPLTVEPEDYVLYTIRVYNEGEIDGYASKIKDTLPVGLKFVEENTEYNNIWNLEGTDTEGRQIVTTTWYAKGQGAELNTTEGDANYTANLLKALNKEGAISNENPDYIDVQILCQVTKQVKLNDILINYAQVAEDSDKDGNPVEDVDSTPDEWIDTDDDQDIEKIEIQYFDLSIRKFVTAVNGTELKDSNGKYTREPDVDVSNLVNGTGTTAVYTQSKEPVEVQAGNKVVYTIRVYNEGNINGYANEITDYLPPYLTYVADSEINKQYEWQVLENGRKVTTRYLSDKEVTAFNGTTLDYEDIKIECIVSENITEKQNQTNIVEISEYKNDKNEILPEDIDSVPDNMESAGYLPKDEDLPTYKDDEMNKPYIPGNEDDDDFEKIVIIPIEKKFDLSLFKHISAISKDQTIEDGEYITDTGNKDGTYLRAPVVTAIDSSTGKIAYKEHDKTPLTVEPEDYVLYTIRVYNEGEIDGYASKIKDTLPVGLKFVEENTEYNNIWNLEGTDTKGRQIVTTTWYAKGQGAELNTTEGDANYTANLLKALNKEGAISNENPDYIDVQILCQVTEQATSNVALINYAEVADDSDKDGNPVEDIDSTPDEWIDPDDDQDIEKIIIETDEKIFDLALRKNIIKINNNELTTAIRIPNVVETENIISYRHRKDPAVVKDGDEITYQIRIYNEGDKAGYATKIIDQLPTGLIRSTNTAQTVTSVDKNGNAKNTYNVEYNTTTNQIILTIVNTTENPAQSLQPYTLGDLDYEIIEIKCKVAQEADQKNQIILTNVAWINGAYNSEDNKEITAVGDDIDSEPSTIPNVDKGHMEDYKGNNNNPEDLSRDDYYYEGQQDDDDFEKVVIMPIEKKFDLALFKHIAAISKDQTIEDGEYVTDTKNKDGVYLRAPVVTAIDKETGEITYTQNDKTPLIVEPGDYVLYTIRVYNEGELDGYASKIKDTLPVGLEFVVENEEYNGIWNIDGVDSDGRQIVTTTWYAKGQGAELNTVEGDANYRANLLRALNKEGTISNENPDYIDTQILCQVTEQVASNRVLVNYAQVAEDSDKDGNPIEDVDSTPDEWIDTDDDQDIEKVQIQYFDLSIRKFVTAVNNEELKNNNGKYTREPDVDVSNLVNGTGTTAVYKQSKEPVGVKVGDKIIYTIRVYNEGSIDGYATEIKDYLPPYLTYAENSQINKQYEWQVLEDGRIVTSTYLANKKLLAFNGTTLDYEDVKIECIVADTAPLKQIQTNIAEISEYEYNGNTVSKDIDSVPDNMESADYLPDDEDLPSYKDDEMNKPYIPGNEDDDDFEKIYVKEFDLSLKKFITRVQDREITTRVPKVKNENGVLLYEQSKDTFAVHVDEVITYTIRVYNEGEIDGYASEITDDIPEYLEYLPDNSTNVEYMWKMYDENGNETENTEEAVKVKTTYLSKENGENNLLLAFDGDILYYRDIKIAFKVKDPNSNTTIITNHAQISEDTDEDGNEIDDKDSEPDEWNEGEDDQDIENVKVEYFDLSLLKYVTKVIVIEGEKETITQTGYNGHEDPEPVVKVELQKKKVDNVTVKFGYGITITNEGDIPGYATEITDYIPEGLKFDPTDNPEWTDEGNNVISTRQLENVLLQPGESTTVEVILTWINGRDNLALKTNIAEISEDKNEFDVPDRDSTPDNNQKGEDDFDIAQVILAIATGAAKTYFSLALGLLAVIATGVFLIKKFVI